jgi:hypothetical protein
LEIPPYLGGRGWGRLTQCAYFNTCASGFTPF